MEAKAVDADAVFKVFTACPDDPKTLLLDVRPQKQFKKGGCRRVGVGRHRGNDLCVCAPTTRAAAFARLSSTTLRRHPALMRAPAHIADCVHAHRDRLSLATCNSPGHINSAYNPRLATNGDFLADYSQSSYSLPWSQDCWCVQCVGACCISRPLSSHA
jgi:hypothetical protein